MKKKLIEVALALDAVNAASAREKSIRRGTDETKRWLEDIYEYISDDDPRAAALFSWNPVEGHQGRLRSLAPCPAS